MATKSKSAVKPVPATKTVKPAKVAKPAKVTPPAVVEKVEASPAPVAAEVTPSPLVVKYTAGKPVTHRNTESPAHKRQKDVKILAALLKAIEAAKSKTITHDEEPSRSPRR